MAGGAIAGPAGAALGAGLGTKVTGGSWSDALKGAALSGIGGELTQGLTGGGWDPTKSAIDNAQVAAPQGPSASLLSTPSSGAAVGSTDPNLIAANAAANPATGTLNATAGPTNFNIGPAPTTLQAIGQYARSAPGIVSGLGALAQPINSSSTAPLTSQQPGPSFGVTPMNRTQVPYSGDLTKYGQAGQGGQHQWFDQVNPPVNYTAATPGLVNFNTPGYKAGGRIGLAMGGAPDMGQPMPQAPMPQTFQGAPPPQQPMGQPQQQPGQPQQAGLGSPYTNMMKAAAQGFQMGSGFAMGGSVAPIQQQLAQQWQQAPQGMMAQGSPQGTAPAPMMNRPPSQMMQQPPQVMMADGGATPAGHGGGQDDTIPAMLSSGEHVWTARETSALGDGDNNEGHRRMYALRKQVLQKAGVKDPNPKKQVPKIKGIGKFKITPAVA